MTKKINTLLVPSAGLGKRMGINTPKTLVKHKGVTLLEIILREYESLVENVIIIIREEKYKSEFIEIIKEFKLSFYFVTQKVANGSFFAITESINQYESLISDYFYVNWGDHPTIKKYILNRMSQSVESNFSLIVPLVKRTSPYVNFRLDNNNKIIEVQESKNMEVQIKIGNNDCGTFLINKSFFMKISKNLSSSTYSELNELNFIKTIPNFEQYGSGVKKLFFKDIKLTQGINTKQELNLIQFKHD